MWVHSVRNFYKMFCPLVLKSDPHLPKKLRYLLHWMPFKNDKKIPFILKAPFVLKIFVFIMTFWSGRKNHSIRRIRLISKFIMSRPGYQTIAIHILPNISKSKSNQTIKLGQLIEYKWNIFTQKLCRKWARETSSIHLSILKKCLIWGRSKWSAA